MIENNTTEIALSKSKLTKLLIFSILFLFGGLWMIIKEPQTSNSLFNHPVIKAIAAYGSAIMGGIGIYFFSRKLFDNKPGLILSDEGITDNTSIFKFGLIPWSDIVEVYEQSVQASVASKQYFLTVSLSDPEKYISKESNGLKKRMMMINLKSYGSPVHISTNGLKTNHKDLLKIVNEYFESYKRLHS
jgi:hypothetical protein